MKKAILIFVVVILVIFTTGMWYFNSVDTPDSSFVVILFVVGFAVVIGIRIFRSSRRGEPVGDELSKRILTKASSLSFYISLYWWLILMYASDKVALESHSLIGLGILGMAVLFSLGWVFFYFKGPGNE